MDEADDSPLAGRHAENTDTVDGEDTPDWTAFAAFTKNLAKARPGSTPSEPIIPKRGEKDFEPASEEKFIHLQDHLLQTSRDALFTAISSGSRYHSSKAHNRAIWDEKLQRAYMIDAPDPALPPHKNAEILSSASGKDASPPATHGIHFQSMGRYEPARKRIELLPEEALCLIERGTIECWSGNTYELVPMSVQHAWSSMIAAAELNAERYQVYANLRRLGYAVIRAELPKPGPEPGKQDNVVVRLQHSLRHTLQVSLNILFSPLRVLCNVLGPSVDALARLRQVGEGKRRSLVGGDRWFTYDQLFTALQFVRTGKDAQLTPKKRKDNPYEVFYHVYKPVTKFKKTDPGKPDFRIAVIDARQTPIPDMYDFARAFSNLPLDSDSSLFSSKAPPKQGKSTSPLSQLSEYVKQLFGYPSKSNKARPQSKTRPAPYAKLKAGKKSAILAVVDSGTVSFQRFGDTDFSELPWVGDGSMYSVDDA